MGTRTAVLLVAITCILQLPAESTELNDYTAFWVWPGVELPAVARQANRLYILQGEQVEKGSVKAVEKRGYNPHHLPAKEVWLVYRTTTIDWSLTDYNEVVTKLYQWQSRGTNVKGVQIDFDAPSLNLGRYGAFLATLRQQVPPEFGISITGLLDWVTSGDVDVLNGWIGIVDEIVVQTYQGRCTVPNYEDYIHGLKRLKLPFRIGVIEHGTWNFQDTTGVNEFPAFQGIVLFLVNRRPSAC